MPRERDNTNRRFAFSLLRFFLAVTLFGAPLAAMSGNGVLGLIVGLIFAIPMAGLALMVPP